MDPINRVKELLQKHLDGVASETEISELDSWKNKSAANVDLYDKWMNSERREDDLMSYLQIESNSESEGQIWEKQLPPEVRDLFPTPVRIFTLRRILYAAAAVTFIILFSVRYFYRHPDKTDIGTKVIAQHDIPAPTGTRTVLTLSNGSKIVLDDARNGELSRQGNASIVKSANGQLVYSTAQNEKQSELMYNTLSTARGGQTQLVLGDGTKVWLNAASSISYPTAFVGKDRTVTITGEAYFEVAKDKSKPFFVKTQGMDVQVLGTNFDVKAYGDEESVRATLLEGSVRVGQEMLGAGAAGKGVVLKPGQQAVVGVGQKDRQQQDGTGIKIVENADTEQAMAWLNGDFAFDTENVDAVMKQLARWYDVDIIYQGAHPTIQLSGAVSKKTSLAAVLKVLAINGVHCRLEGKKLIVQ